MWKASKIIKAAAVGGVLAIGTAIAMSGAALAGGYDNDGHAYCDADGYNCYQVRPGDRDRPDYRSDYRDGRYDYRDSDRDEDGGGYYRDSRSRYYREGYDRDWHTVCDPDGDRCYGSTSDYWNYREYYRRLGYRWHD